MASDKRKRKDVERFVRSRRSSGWRVPRRGGLADGRSASDFGLDPLVDGLLVELEHTDDWDTALAIAVDHLTEDPRYYTKLAIMESSPRYEQMARRLAEGG